MQRQPVDSSNLSSVGYDPDSSTLEVEFRSGHVYRYSDVPEQTYKNLLGASSPGEFFRSNVMGQFDEERVK